MYNHYLLAITANFDFDLLTIAYKATSSKLISLFHDVIEPAGCLIRLGRRY